MEPGSPPKRRSSRRTPQGEPLSLCFRISRSRAIRRHSPCRRSWMRRSRRFCFRDAVGSPGAASPRTGNESPRAHTMGDKGSGDPAALRSQFQGAGSGPVFAVIIPVSLQIIESPWERCESSGGQLRADSLLELRNLPGAPMVPDFVPFYAIVIVLFSLGYFSLASISFLLVPLHIPEVSRLFRGLFNVHFWMFGFTAFVSTAVFSATGRMAVMAAMLLLAATAIAGGRVVQLIDTQQTAWRSGDVTAMRRLRLLHWGVMLANIGILASVASSA